MTTFIRKLMMVLAICAASLSFAERTNFKGYPNYVSFDLPEEFKLEETNGNSIYRLFNPVQNVSGLITFYTQERYETPGAAMDDIMKKLGLQFDMSTFTWNKESAAVSMYSGIIAGEKISGYGTATPVPSRKTMALILAYCPEELAAKNNSMMVSFVDSFFNDVDSYFIPGPMTSFTFPDSGKTLPVKLEIAGKKIETKVDSNARDGAQYLIDREYSVLLLYQKSDQWQKAWQRYYRMIFRDSYGRISTAAYDITEALASESADYTELAQKLLDWTTGMKYSQEAKTGGFSPLPSILLGQHSDCDSRSMLIAVIMQSINQDAIIFVSAEHHHAIAGLVSDHPGFAFTVDDRNYLTGDSTKTGITWGKISADQADQSKWIPVMLP